MFTTRSALAAAFALVGVLVSAKIANAQPTFRLVHAFAGSGPLPAYGGSLIRADDGNFYGTTDGGGSANLGAVFKITPGGEFSVLHSFAGGTADGHLPAGGVIQGRDGAFYGMTRLGGAFGKGTVYIMSTGGAVTILHAFAGGATDGSQPAANAALVEAENGVFYGTTRLGGVSDRGTIFKITSNGVFTLLHSFAGGSAAGDAPAAPLIRGVHGEFYGTTNLGCGISGRGYGTVFKSSSEGIVTVLHCFTGLDGAYPDSALVQGSDGNLYGTTPHSYGAPNSAGTAFKITTTGAFTRLRGFSAAESPSTPLIQAADGNFYFGGGSYSDTGVVFKMAPTGSVTVVHRFGGAPNDGAWPACVIQTASGAFYGLTRYGGAPDEGTIFTMTPQYAVTLLHTFRSGGVEGAESSASLMQASDGNFYGTAAIGGTADLGTVFRITPAGVVTVLHSFAGGPGDGAKPRGALVQAPNGKLYGTTPLGGASDLGTVFEMTLGGELRILHSFPGTPTGGEQPYAGLIADADGVLYGTTPSGGVGSNWGTVFAMTPTGAITILHSFAGGPTDGQWPFAPLIRASDGYLYGTTQNGGGLYNGTIFRMAADGTVTVGHSFAYPGEYGGNPIAALVQGQDQSGSVLYGTVPGVNGPGAVFKMSWTGGLSWVRSFMGAPDGHHPGAALIYCADGVLRGTTQGGGAFNKGTVYRLAVNGAGTLVHSFNGADGELPVASLIEAADGSLWGTTSAGGPLGGGTIFRIRDNALPFTDDPLTPGASQIRAVHISELRARIDVLRQTLGLPAFSWTDPVLTAGQTTMKAQHIIDLRTALAATYTAAGASPPTYTDSVLGPGTTIKAVHFMELRTAVTAIE